MMIGEDGWLLNRIIMGRLSKVYQTFSMLVAPLSYSHRVEDISAVVKEIVLGVEIKSSHPGVTFLSLGSTANVELLVLA